MKKVIITKGLSGSGKTTWANEYKNLNPNTIIISKDDIRQSFGVIYGDSSTRVKESKIIEKRNDLIIQGLENKNDIIICDTNLNPVHEKNIKALIFPKYENEYEVEVKSFLDIPISICIERCKNRPEGKKFWENVIWSQSDEWLEQIDIIQDDSLPKCVITDHDGTIAHVSKNRSPYDGTHSSEDLENEIVCDYLRMMKQKGYLIFVLSGLEDKFHKQRSDWLDEHSIEYDGLFMRKTGDNRADWIIKNEIYEEHIKDKFFVYSILDDRRQMLRYWILIGFGKRLFSIGNIFKEF